VLLDAGRDREDVRVEDQSSGEADLLGEQLVRALADLDLALDGRPPGPCSSKAITTTPARTP
jgi:hypothetical protein